MSESNDKSILSTFLEKVAKIFHMISEQVINRADVPSSVSVEEIKKFVEIPNTPEALDEAIQNFEKQQFTDVEEDQLKDIILGFRNEHDQEPPVPAAFFIKCIRIHMLHCTMRCAKTISKRRYFESIIEPINLLLGYNPTATITWSTTNSRAVKTVQSFNAFCKFFNLTTVIIDECTDYAIEAFGKDTTFDEFFDQKELRKFAVIQTYQMLDNIIKHYVDMYETTHDANIFLDLDRDIVQNELDKFANPFGFDEEFVDNLVDVYSAVKFNTKQGEFVNVKIMKNEKGLCDMEVITSIKPTKDSKDTFSKCKICGTQDTNAQQF